MSRIRGIILDFLMKYLFRFHGVLMVSWSGHGVLGERLGLNEFGDFVSCDEWPTYMIAMKWLLGLVPLK